MKTERHIIKKLLTVIGILFAVSAAGIIILTAVSMYRSNRIFKQAMGRPSEPYTAPALDFTVADSEEPLEIDTFQISEAGSLRSIRIYDAAYLDRFFDFDSVTSAEIKRVIRDNDGIGDRFKELLYRYIESITARYPQADLRVLYYNLQTMEVVEHSRHELAFDALSLNSYGCYKPNENKIYVNRDYEYEPGTWEYQVVMHEFGHAARTLIRTVGDTSVYVSFSSENLTIPEEALDSVFTVSLFDYEERDIAYQLQSNMVSVMIECLDNYSPVDYLNHSLSYFAHKLDEQTGHNNYAMSIMRLMQEQRADGMDDRYEREQKTYYPLYDFLCALYLGHYAPDGGTKEEITRLVDTLVEKVTYDVPEEYHIDVNEFYRYAERLLLQNE